MIKYRYEYRINKKGAECYRTGSQEEALRRMDELSSNRPGIYTLQSRSCRMDHNGVCDRDYKGRPAWSPWN